MKREYKLNIMGTEYTVDFVDRVLENDDEIIAEGKCNSAQRTITVSTVMDGGKALPDNEIVKNFLHELIHAYLDEGQYMNESEDEPLVEWLARCLSGTLAQILAFSCMKSFASLQDQQKDL